MCKTSRKTIYANGIFNHQLHGILEAAEENGFQHIFSWTKDGKAFEIKDRKLFEKDICPQYFNHGSFRSFQKQLSNWYIYKVFTTPRNPLVYHHPLLRRGKKELVRFMSRRVEKNKASKQNVVRITKSDSAEENARTSIQALVDKANGITLPSTEKNFSSANWGSFGGLPELDQSLLEIMPYQLDSLMPSFGDDEHVTAGILEPDGDSQARAPNFASDILRVLEKLATAEAAKPSIPLFPRETGSMVPSQLGPFPFFGDDCRPSSFEEV